MSCQMNNIPEKCSPEMAEFILTHMQNSREFAIKINNEWIQIGELEYKISYTFCSERMNIIYRNPNEVSALYNILHTFSM